MPFFRKLVSNIRNSDWNKILTKIQFFSAYIPVLIVPALFIPVTSDPYIVEKIFTIMFFSSISLLSWGGKQLFASNKNKKSDKRIKNEVKTDEKRIKIFTSPLIKYFSIFIIFAVISNVFSVNFNLSLWGVGTVLFLSCLLWLLAIYQVYDEKKIKLSLVIGITIVSIINLTVLLTRFRGVGVFESINASTFSTTWDTFSLLFVLFLGISLSIKESLSHERKYLYISCLFLSLLSFIIYAYSSGLYIFYYVLISLFLAFNLIKFSNFKIRKKKKIEKNVKKTKKVNKNIDLDYIFKIIVVVAAIVVGIFEIYLQKDYLYVDRTPFPANYSWNISVKSLTENPKNLFFGVGANNYQYDYVHFKPAEVNKTDFWSNNYLVSPYSIFEIIDSLGLLVIISFLIFYFVKRRREYKVLKNKRSFFLFLLKSNPLRNITILIGTLIFLTVPLTITGFWLVIVLASLKINTLTERDFFVDSINNDKKLNISAPTAFFTSLLLAIPFFVISLLLIVSSVLVSIGYHSGNGPLANTGSSLFTYYPSNISMAVNTLKNIKDDNLQSIYLTKAREIARSAYMLNPEDPSSYLPIFVSYQQYNPDYSTNTSVSDFYVKLTNMAPHHVPYYLNLADVQSYLGNYDVSLGILDNVLTESPGLDIALLKKAGIYLTQENFTLAKSYAESVKNVSKSQKIINSADAIIKKSENR